MRPNPFKVINFGKLIRSLGWSSLFRVQSGRSMAINPKHQSASAKFSIFRADKLPCLTCCRLAQLVHPSEFLPASIKHQHSGAICRIGLMFHLKGEPLGNEPCDRERHLDIWVHDQNLICYQDFKPSLA